jgi:BirA family biotin operon repressor/biotin-[acetyl-CoA-carboxylase] ligase
MTPALTVLESVDSSNGWLAERAQAGAPEGTAVLALEQAAGRGRHGRAWVSPRGNLHLSVLLRPQSPPETVGQIGMLAALALIDTLPPGLAAQLKWPNDVLVGDAKLAGVLVETACESARLAWAVVGIGANLASHPSLPDRPATSLPAHGVAPPAPMAFAQAVLASLAARYAAWQMNGFAAQRATWLALGPRPGARIGVRLPNEVVEGSFLGIDAIGGLQLATPAGARTLTAGDIVAP